MITYDRLWITMKVRGVSQYKMIHSYGMSSGQMSRLRKNMCVSTYTLNRLCLMLGCRVEEIMEFIPEAGEQIYSDT